MQFMFSDIIKKQLKILKRVKILGDKKLNRYFWKRIAKSGFTFLCEVILEHPVIQTELCQLRKKKCYQKIRKMNSKKTLSLYMRLIEVASRSVR